MSITTEQAMDKVSILTHKATDKDVEYAIALMKECGYIRFRVETIGK